MHFTKVNEPFLQNSWKSDERQAGHDRNSNKEEFLSRNATSFALAAITISSVESGRRSVSEIGVFMLVGTILIQELFQKLEVAPRCPIREIFCK